MIQRGKHDAYFTSRLKFYSQTSCKNVLFRGELVIDNRTVCCYVQKNRLLENTKYKTAAELTIIVVFRPMCFYTLKTITDLSFILCCKQAVQTTLLQAVQLSSELIT